MPEITLDHLRQACDWAETAAKSPQPIDGKMRSYSQSTWDCGTACCIWGAASIISGNGPVSSGPPKEWKTDFGRTLIAGLLGSSISTPSRIRKAIEDYADLRDADLRDADLSGADLRDADLRDADLRDANLSDADLRDADLRDANLRDANLRGADLRGADLSGANLSDADLSGADLSGANLSDADLSDADLSGANLSDATVSVGNVSRRIS